MPRARNIKHSFFSNDELADIEPLGRLLFIGMWTLADYKGDFEWREKKVKASILPYDNCDIKKLAINLDKSGFIRFYSDGDKVFVRIVNFSKHQNPHKNERDKGTDIPEYCDTLRQAIDLKALTINRDKSRENQESSTSDPADSCFLNPDSGSLKDDPQDPEKPPKPADADYVVVFNYWKQVMGKQDNTKLSPKRKQKIEARLKDYTLDEIKRAIDNCKRSDYHMGSNDQGTVYDDIELICRNAEKLEWFRDMAGKAKQPIAKQSIIPKHPIAMIEWAEKNGYPPPGSRDMGAYREYLERLVSEKGEENEQ